MPTTIKIANADAPFDIVWDHIGVAHVYAQTQADAYRGMGYAAGSERLWQIHLSTAFANGEAAALLGPRFVPQDAIQRACNVDGRQTPLPESPGDWVVDAYLDGLNAVVDQLTELPPEFQQAGATPRHFTRRDIAARYRFTAWFQHKSWTEKMVLGRLMATHGVDYFREHVLHFSDADAEAIHALAEPLRSLDPAALQLAVPDLPTTALTGSNNWAVTGDHTASGKPLLAMDPHQAYSIPNTFFYTHLHAGDWDVFGAAFPGVPYFMMGYTQDLAWGLTTGFVDNYDIYIERLTGQQVRTPDGAAPLATRTEHIAVKGGPDVDVDVLLSRHGPLLEPLARTLGWPEATGVGQPEFTGFGTALAWALADVPTSAGALALLPMAATAEDFGVALFEHDVCPLVNNIICVDQQNHLRRFIATTTPARTDVTGSVPLPGWDARYDFAPSTAADLVVEVDPPSGYALTANNDTMGERGAFYIHNFPTHSARADRIEQLVGDQVRAAADAGFTSADFTAAQLDITDMRAGKVLPDLLDVLARSSEPKVQRAVEILRSWDHSADVDAAAPCLLYPFLDRFWARSFMRSVLQDDLVNVLPVGAPGLNRFDIAHFMAAGSPWRAHETAMVDSITTCMTQVFDDVVQQLGPDTARWRWGDLNQVAMRHSLAKHGAWGHMQVGPDPVGGSPTTLAMATHRGPGPGRAGPDEVPCQVYVGPAFRLVVDLGDPNHAQFVISSGNGGSTDSPFAIDNYPLWLTGQYHTLSLLRSELQVIRQWQCAPA